jgi:hypothetical protein
MEAAGSSETITYIPNQRLSHPRVAVIFKLISTHIFQNSPPFMEFNTSLQFTITCHIYLLNGIKFIGLPQVANQDYVTIILI